MKKFFTVLLILFVGMYAFAAETKKNIIHQERFLKYETNGEGVVVSIQAKEGYCLFVTNGNTNKNSVEYGGNGCKAINFAKTGFLYGSYAILVFPEGKFEYQRKAETMVGKEFIFYGIK